MGVGEVRLVEGIIIIIIIITIIIIIIIIITARRVPPCRGRTARGIEGAGRIMQTRPAHRGESKGGRVGLGWVGGEGVLDLPLLLPGHNLKEGSRQRFSSHRRDRKRG